MCVSAPKTSASSIPCAASAWPHSRNMCTRPRSRRITTQEKMHMRDIIKDRQIVADDWQVLKLAEGDTAESVAIPEGRVIVPLAVWQARRDALKARGNVAVWLASDDRPEALKDDVASLALIAVDFPKFA